MWRIACALLVASPAVALAADVSWTAPSSCPDAATLRGAIEARLGAALDSVELTADISVDVEAEQYVARVVITDGVEDARTIASADCSELTDAVALVIARVALSLPRAAPAVVVSEPVPVPAVATPAWNGGAHVTGLFGTGTSPGIQIAGEVGGWLAWHSLSVALAASQWTSGTATLDRTMAGVDIDVRAVSLRVGWRPDRIPLRAWLVGRWGQIRGEAFGLDDGRGGAARWTAVGAGAGWSFPIARHVRALAASEVELLLDRATFSLDRGTELYRTPPMALHGSITIEVGWR